MWYGSIASWLRNWFFYAFILLLFSEVEEAG